MDLYFVKRSGPAARALAVLAELELPFTPHLLNPREGENKTAAYLALNPMGKVPSLVDGPVVLWESTAIAWYLAEKYGAGKLLPATVEGRAEVVKWLSFLLGHVAPAQGGAFYNSAAGAALFNRAPDRNALENAHKELARFLPVLDAQLARTPYLAGEFSIADLCYAPAFVALDLAGYDYAALTHVGKWWKEVGARPSVVTARTTIGL
jgi:glutathione S-transferase